MGLLNRKKPRDTNALSAALARGTYDEFQAAYDPAWVHYDGFSGNTLLTKACAHNKPPARIAIVNRLLDDGADATIGKPVHNLVGANTHDFQGESVVVTRLLDAGADVNQVAPGFGTPLETAAGKFKFSDDDLTPFYDVFLARPELDLLQPGLDGRPVLVNLRKWYSLRAGLVERAEALLVERDIPMPPPEQ